MTAPMIATIALTTTITVASIVAVSCKSFYRGSLDAPLFLSREVVMWQYLFAPADRFYCLPTLCVGAARILISLLVELPIGFSVA
jgi:hypothetical protein